MSNTIDHKIQRIAQNIVNSEILSVQNTSDDTGKVWLMEYLNSCFLPLEKQYERIFKQELTEREFLENLENIRVALKQHREKKIYSYSTEGLINE